MIHLITGQPGAGKTLYALNYVQQAPEFQGRQIYYSGINDLRLPWSEIDKGEDWHTLPPGSVVVIDECQRVFRPRGSGSAVPVHVSKLETHRHDGLDLVLITQHPMLVDQNVRRLIGRHMHVVRAFGLHRATVHEWGEVKENCDKLRTGSVRHDFAYPAQSFGWYKSAEVHTHKRRVPARVWFLLAMPLLLAVCVYGVVRWWAGQGDKNRIAEKVTGKPVVGQIVGAPGGGPAKMTTAEFIEAHQPRIQGLAYTAPVYDDLTKPDAVPFPDGCFGNKSRCVCYTDQGTRVDVGEQLCRQILAKGIFRPFGNRTGDRLADRSKERVEPRAAEAPGRFKVM